ncbi:MAG: flagellar basal-body MS-ring/collar protein FliF [candidate division KSB1 bacterium]|nr:flagellar basal-body MS-ring/collar protein FliF [candidate division KSB1 bacterium]
MPEALRQAAEKLRQFWSALNLGQKAVLVGSVVGSIVLVLALVHWASRPDYTVLFTNLDPKDASTIVEQLRAKKVPYELRDGGTTILVPQEKVYELRLELAGQGLPLMGTVGYEIFDRNNIGLTDFVQKVNYRRALEGELARTISTLAEISSARVHIVVPEPSLYASEQKEPTASIALRLRPGARLSPVQVQGIANLVASSVEGLRPENVTIVDSYGNVLNARRERETLASLTASQIELQRDVEDYLGQKVMSLLEGVVGPGRARVRVTAELDFDQVERTQETYDAENPAIRSQETSLEILPQGQGGGRRESNVTNYELNRTVERVVQSPGAVRRVTVAAIVDGRYQPVKGPDGKQTQQFVPRSQEELDKLTALVQSAIGYDAKRGDRVEVTCLPIQNPEEEELREVDRRAFLFRVLEKVALGLAVLLLLGLIRSGIRDFREVAMAYLRRSSEEVGEPEAEKEVLERLDRRRQVVYFARRKPDDAAKLVRTWLVQDHR